MNKSENANKIIQIADDYFHYMARHYPVMCLSDEFYFFPRAKKALQFLGVLDSFAPDKIKQDISYINNLRTCVKTLNSNTRDLEQQIDLTLLDKSMSGFIREFEDFKIEQTDPTLYLKVILFGIYHLLSRFSHTGDNIEDDLKLRLGQIPRLLTEAKNNLGKKIAQAHLETALAMTDSLIDYLKTLHPKPCMPAIASLKDFKTCIIKKTPQEYFVKDRQLLKDILSNSFGYHRGLDEIFDIASEEYHNTLCELKRIAKTVNPHKSWQQILAKYQPDAKDIKGLLALYSNQIQKIKSFLKKKDIITIPQRQNICVQLTPKFMQPIRASASYNSYLTGSLKEQAYFYITADFAKKAKFGIIHNEYMFVTAHETYPGHHLLDVMREQLKNPIRQQIESPLFYEGWASYAEGLIDELGYIKQPRQKLVGLRRKAWRAVRAMLDVGIRIDKLKLDKAAGLLKHLGYEAPLVKSMLRHYVVMPGYQLCYTMGKYEIGRLRKQFAQRLGLKEFHDFIVSSGQIPFDLLEKRIKKQLCRKNS